MTDDSSKLYAVAEEYLYGRINYERQTDDQAANWDFKLETVLQLLNRRGNPHWQYPIIHVAGTKGKGSVVSMIAGILAASGYRTGVYYSPHLEIVRERIVVEGEMISANDFRTLIESFRSDVAEIDRQSSDRNELHPPTFFEIMTAAAFDYFAQRDVDAAVVEVGMGGRLDSTNVCRPVLTVITNVGIDHQRQLGATRPLIAAEKAGIIKPGVPVICGVQNGKSVEVIADVARRHNATVYWLGQEFRFSVAPIKPHSDEPTPFNTWGQVGRQYDLQNCVTSLIGRHQASNAAIATAAAQWLSHHRWHITDESIRAGLRDVQLLGRFQLVGGTPPVVLDIAHNEISIRAFVQTLLERFGPVRDGRTLIFSASSDKKISRMLKLLLPHFDRIILTKIVSNPRGCELSDLQRLCERVLSQWTKADGPLPILETASHSQQAWEFAHQNSRPTHCIAVTGSAFLIGEMLPVARDWSARKRPFVE